MEAWHLKSYTNCFTTIFGVWEGDVTYCVHVPGQSWLKNAEHCEATKVGLRLTSKTWWTGKPIAHHLFFLSKSLSDWLAAASLLLLGPQRHVLRRNTSTIEIQNVGHLMAAKKVRCLTRLNELLPKVNGRLPLLSTGFCPALLSPRPMPPEKWELANWWNFLTIWGASSCPCQRQ